MIINRTERVTSVCKCESCVNRRDYKIVAHYQGKELVFCNEDCLTEFEDDPELFIKSDHFKVKFEMLEDIN